MKFASRQSDPPIAALATSKVSAVSRRLFHNNYLRTELYTASRLYFLLLTISQAASSPEIYYCLRERASTATAVSLLLLRTANDDYDQRRPTTTNYHVSGRIPNLLLLPYSGPSSGNGVARYTYIPEAVCYCARRIYIQTCHESTSDRRLPFFSLNLSTTE